MKKLIVGIALDACGAAATAGPLSSDKGRLFVEGRVSGVDRKLAPAAKLPNGSAQEHHKGLFAAH